MILFIVFLIKQDEIYSNLKTTKFFERLFGKTPTFIENHEVKENNNKEIELEDAQKLSSEIEEGDEVDIIENPKIILPNRRLDYGNGFYTTTSFLQAEEWAKRKMRQLVEVSYVNVYEVDEKELKNFKNE